MDPYGGSAYGYSPYYGASSYYAGYGSSPYYGYSSYYAGYGTVAQPIGVTASAPTGSTITLSWATSSGAASYQVYQAPGAAGPFALVTTSATTSATISGLNPSTTYYYQVLAVSSVGVQSAPSAVVAATTLASSSTTLAPPTGLTVAGVTPNSVTLSWVASSGASHYRVYSSLYGGAQYVLAGSSTSGVTSATVAGLTPATTYVFYVVGVDSVGTESSPSSAIYVVTSLSQGGVSYLERRR
jgi:chitinase